MAPHFKSPEFKFVPSLQHITTTYRYPLVGVLLSQKSVQFGQTGQNQFFSERFEAHPLGNLCARRERTQQNGQNLLRTPTPTTASVFPKVTSPSNGHLKSSASVFRFEGLKCQCISLRRTEKVTRTRTCLGSVKIWSPGNRGPCHRSGGHRFSTGGKERIFPWIKIRSLPPRSLLEAQVHLGLLKSL